MYSQFVHDPFKHRSIILEKSDFLHSLRLVPLAIMLADFQKERSIPVRSFSGDLIKKSPLGMMQGC
ncbi:hypothetical protein, partial [Parageobacillus toebii]|uniref:hypothetical protein n=1 Tax=Parageobacillus toebii TaxID=153151 RepID=UPI00128FD439